MKHEDGLYSLVIGVGAAVAALALVCLAALLGVWLFGGPAQAAPPDPTPTTYVLLPSPTATAGEDLPAITPEPTAIPAATIVVGANGANVRSGPGTHYERTGYLDPGARAAVTGWYGEWWQIAYAGAAGWVYGPIVAAFDTAGTPQVQPPPAPTIPAIPAPASHSALDEERWIDVDLSQQVLVAYEGSVPVHTTLISTGLPATPTPTGQFRIWIKLRFDDMAGEGYYLENVPYVMYFYQGYGLHGVTWHGNFGHPMSHGCVNLSTSDAEWLFGWADVGTLVNVHE